jgi:riboflavin kinase
VHNKLPASLFQSALDSMTNGVYFGWAVIEQPTTTTTTSSGNIILKGRDVPVKAVVNIGYSPTFEGKENREKIVEAHLITRKSPMTVPESDAYDGSSEFITEGNATEEIEGDFYGETMRLQLIGFLRQEKKFDSFPELIAQIHRDIGNASWALDSMPFIFSKEDFFIKHGISEWIGSGGGDSSASWENEVW